MRPFDFERARQYALYQLEQKLSPSLFYHSLAHTRDDVVVAARRLAAEEGVVGEARLLLLTAAYFHDIGFVYQRTNHEAIGARMAAEALPRMGYGNAHVQLIQDMIMATQLPQRPHTLLERILADADLDVLGREDFWLRNQALRAEMSIAGLSMTDEVWFSSQLRFLQTHHYFTLAACELRAEQKARNIERLAQWLAVCRARNRQEAAR